MTAAVRGVTAASTAAGSRPKLPGSMSANTTSAPTSRTALAEAANEKDGTITSSPGPMPRASRSMCSAEVPELTATQWRPSTSSEKPSSKAATSGPCTTRPLRSTRTAASISSSPMTGRAAGIGCSLMLVMDVLLEHRKSSSQPATAVTLSGISQVISGPLTGYCISSETKHVSRPEGFGAGHGSMNNRLRNARQANQSESAAGAETVTEGDDCSVATVFFAAAFFVVVFFAVAFFATVLVAVFLAGAFLAVAFLAVFRAAVFLTGAS